MKPTPKIGQILFLVSYGWRQNDPVTTSEVKVCAVGRKYFTVQTVEKHPRQTVFHIEDWCEKTNFPSRVGLYENEQEWKDKKEKSEICSYLSRWDSWRFLPLETLRQIKELATSNVSTAETKTP